MERINIIQPDDFHIHLRDGPMLARTVRDAAASFRRALVMPNLSPPIQTPVEAESYAARIQAAVPQGLTFTPLLSLYLTDKTTPETVVAAKDKGIIGFKLYPANVTTNAQFGVSHIERLEATFDAMQACDLPLLIHGETTDPAVDIFDREAVFIEKTLIPLVEKFPRLRIVLEHITTKEAVAFVTSAPQTIAATITAHHLWVTRNDLLIGGIHPHLYCLPIPKRAVHQERLIQAAISGNPKFFLGSDSAPHVKSKKEAVCGCAGIYTAFSALPLYVQIFEKYGALERFEHFASAFGADFYRLPRNRTKISLVRLKQKVPELLAVDSEYIVPFKAGEILEWQVVPLEKM